MLSRRRAINLLEVSDKMALVSAADHIHDFLDAEERRFQQIFRLLHSDCPQVLRRRRAGFSLEEIVET